ncbi:pyridoxal-phosphate dependent enzyme [Alkaliphilus sp. MSJ-5]|uniref:Pyridoxal-phosphate dependent enzyme n=1 Tax=Alkaliphilus flagellatus TaxID=2841507 RepID=A0ABS6FY46_9FIRM|nr:pyridoxal-phosphate dependent enzyme [Alkaliphilus flagellatus]MBU5675158.1 pyridoxal-phosphate dependent enzyme [Alkaliphilus flagellatus]
MKSLNKIDLFNSVTPMIKLESIDIKSNEIYMKREDLAGFVLGGNKLRKIEYFMYDAISKKSDYIVTYGSYQSNHCAITAAACSKLGLKCLLILTKQKKQIEYTGNYFLYNLFDAEIMWCEEYQVKDTIDETLTKLTENGHKSYFIEGGGHGNLGTYAYVKVYEEIKAQESKMKVNFDYIFHASGSGTTQAGLIIGNENYKANTKILGISIARKQERGSKVIEESILDYCHKFNIQVNNIKSKIHFIDDYVGKGYGDSYYEVLQTIKYVGKNEGILLDPIYTGKAFYGMIDYIRRTNIKGKNILFIHTGGIPILLANSEKFIEIGGDRSESFIHQ